MSSDCVESCDVGKTKLAQGILEDGYASFR